MKITMVLLLLILAQKSFAKSKFALKESIAVHLKLGGDLVGEYDLAGPLGSEITAEADAANAACSVQATFRKARYGSQDLLELWLTLFCTQEGQKRSYKPHRIFLDPQKSEQKIQMPMLAKKLKNVWLEFRNLSLIKSK